MRLTQKQETFALGLFNGLSQREAYLKAGYSAKQAPATLDRNAFNLAKSNKIITRWDELRKKAEDASVGKFLERQQVLTEIMRGRLTDYMTMGADGAFFDIGPEKINKAALQGAKTRHIELTNGLGEVVINSIALRDPIPAIAELNKMDGVYATAPTLNIDNRKLEIIVEDKETKELLTEITEGKSPHAPEDD